MPNRYQIVYYTHETGHDVGREFPTIKDCMKEITHYHNWCRMLDSDTTDIPFGSPDPIYFEWAIYDHRLQCWRKSSPPASRFLLDFIEKNFAKPP